jgi:tetratricopeptide (TPR) repeat protein
MSVHCSSPLLRRFMLVAILLLGYLHALAAGSDTAEVIRLANIASDSAGSPYNDRLAAGNKALAMATTLKYNRGIALANLSLGKLVTGNGDNTGGLKYYSTALQVAKENGFRQIQGDALTRYGNLYGNISLYDSSFICYARAIDIFESIRDTFSLGHAYNGLARIYAQTGNMPSTYAYLQKALAINAGNRFPLLTANTYTNLVIYYFFNNKIDSSLRCGAIAVKIYDSIGDRYSIGELYQNVASVYYATKQYDSALNWYNKAVVLFRQRQNKYSEAGTLIDIGHIYWARHNYTEAEKYYKASLQISKEIKFYANIYQNEKCLAELASYNKDWSAAYQYLDAAQKVKDTMISEEKVKSLAELTTRYEVKQIQDRNTILAKENDIQKLRLRQKDILVYAGFGLTLLAMVIGVLIYRQSRLKAQQQKMEMEQKQLLAQINPHFIFNCLTSIQQFIYQNDIMNAGKYLTDFARLTRQTLDNSMTETIALTDEIAYLQNYLKFEQLRFEDKFDYSITCEPDVETDVIDIPGMIIQPFAENAIKHGLCTLTDRKGMLTIHFSDENNVLVCRIDDNGIGREEARRRKALSETQYKSHGMDITAKRLALVSKMQGRKYDITIIDKKDAVGNATGTTVVIRFP